MAALNPQRLVWFFVLALMVALATSSPAAPADLPVVLEVSQ